MQNKAGALEMWNYLQIGRVAGNEHKKALFPPCPHHVRYESQCWLDIFRLGDGDEKNSPLAPALLWE